MVTNSDLTHTLDDNFHNDLPVVASMLRALESVFSQPCWEYDQVSLTSPP